MVDESMPLAVRCSYRRGLRYESGIGPYGIDELRWRNTKAYLVEETTEEGGILAAVIQSDATPEPFRADYKTGTVSTPSGTYSFHDMCRCNPDGSYVAAFFQPAWIQLRDAREAASQAHVADIEALIERRLGRTKAGRLSELQAFWRPTPDNVIIGSSLILSVVILALAAFKAPPLFLLAVVAGAYLPAFHALVWIPYSKNREMPELKDSWRHFLTKLRRLRFEREEDRVDAIREHRLRRRELAEGSAMEGLRVCFHVHVAMVFFLWVSCLAIISLTPIAPLLAGT